MKKISINSPCPCGTQKKYKSGRRKKYKNCCAIYHKGALAHDVFALIRSRYSAYALSNSKYIMKTTHPNNPDYSTDKESWRKTIEAFSNSTEFLKLDVLEAVQRGDDGFVKFKATLSSGEMLEESHFKRVNNAWLYLSGEIISTSDSTHPTAL
jgi:SEC-C motif-containing protein